MFSPLLERWLTFFRANDSDRPNAVLVRLVFGAAVAWRFCAFVHSVFADHAGNPQITAIMSISVARDRLP
jgi:hypothetical protein